jgi:hypothetical protein
MNNAGQEGISEGLRLAQSERAVPGGAGAKGSATRFRSAKGADRGPGVFGLARQPMDGHSFRS